jgi:ABC-type sugar transport system ATPase subunit
MTLNPLSTPDVATGHPAIEARGITKYYGNIVALEDVDITVYPGEIVGLVGDNGAGKSTLVKILAGAHQPSGGDLFVNG